MRGDFAIVNRQFRKDAGFGELMGRDARRSAAETIISEGLRLANTFGHAEALFLVESEL